VVLGRSHAGNAGSNPGGITTKKLMGCDSNPFSFSEIPAAFPIYRTNLDELADRFA